MSSNTFWWVMTAAAGIAITVIFAMMQYKRGEEQFHAAQKNMIITVLDNTQREPVMLTGEYVDMYLDIVDLIEEEWKERQL